MAAVTSYSLLRNCAATTRRAFVAVKASNHNFTKTKFLLPLQSRRYLCRIYAANNEEAAAKVAAMDADSGAPTIFDKIIAKEIPASIIYEDEKVLAFRDVSPQAPVHVLVIPKLRDGLTQLGKAEPRHVEILGQLLHAAKIVAEKEGILDGFRVVINNGPNACQSVYHLHLHVLGGRQMKWPPEPWGNLDLKYNIINGLLFRAYDFGLFVRRFHDLFVDPERLLARSRRWFARKWSKSDFIKAHSFLVLSVIWKR